VRWETEQPFDGQLCHKYVYPKLLKLDNSSSSYGKKNWVCFYAPQCSSQRDRLPREKQGASFVFSFLHSATLENFALLGLTFSCLLRLAFSAKYRIGN